MGSNTIYTVIRDSREHKGEGWFFDKSSSCNGTIIKSLKTGDYSLVGYEDLFTVERKKSVREFAQNIYEKRFEKELIRLESFAFPYIVFEFTMNDIMRWPLTSGIPLYMHSKIKTTQKFLLKRFMDFQIEYKTKIIFAGSYGKEICESLFKRVLEHYETQPKRDKSGRFVGKTEGLDEGTVGVSPPSTRPRKTRRKNK